MPEPITVCVFALTHGQIDQVKDDDLKNLLIGNAAAYNVIADGRVYGASPDDWSPFDDNVTIYNHLQDNGFAVTSLSELLEDFGNPENQSALIQSVQLYVIDPLFLALGDEYVRLVEKFEGVIIGTHKEFCIVIPQRMPQELRGWLQKISSDHLKMLNALKFARGRGLRRAQDNLQLEEYLARLTMMFGERRVNEQRWQALGNPRLTVWGPPALSPAGAG